MARARLSFYYDVRNLLAVTNAHKVLAQARSTEVLARTQVLAALAEHFRTGDAIEANPRKIHQSSQVFGNWACQTQNEGRSRDSCLENE
jgi:hypothetical protein